MIEDALIAAIEEAPDDPAPRIVYADWLAERGDPRADLVQLAAEMWQEPIDPVRVGRLYLRREDLACDPRWLARIEQPSFAELRRRVRVLAALDPGCVALGARRHRYELLPPLSPAEVAAIEDRLGCALPADYRRFVTELSCGGAGPGYGLTPLPEVTLHRSRPGALGIADDLSSSFWLMTAGPEAGTVGREIVRFEPLAMSFLVWYVRGLDDALWRRIEATRATDALLAHAPHEVAYVNLRECQLVQVPPQLRRLVHVRRLDLEHNAQLTELPDWIGELTELDYLSITDTGVRRLPDAIATLRRLRYLLCEHARLEVLPDWIGELTELRALELAHCALAALPASIGALPHLVHLELAANRLVALPASIGRMRLRSLRVEDNQLTALPDELAGLVELDELDLSGNRLRALPAWIGALPRLERIGLNRMPIDLADAFRTLARIPTLRRVELGDAGHTTLPPEVGLLTQLEALILPANHISALPDELAQLTRLRRLSVGGNPLPREAVARLLPNLQR